MGCSLQCLELIYRDKQGQGSVTNYPLETGAPGEFPSVSEYRTGQNQQFFLMDRPCWAKFGICEDCVIKLLLPRLVTRGQVWKWLAQMCMRRQRGQCRIRMNKHRLLKVAGQTDASLPMAPAKTFLLLLHLELISELGPKVP